MRMQSMVRSTVTAYPSRRPITSTTASPPPKLLPLERLPEELARELAHIADDGLRDRVARAIAISRWPNRHDSFTWTRHLTGSRSAIRRTAVRWSSLPNLQRTSASSFPGCG